MGAFELGDGLVVSLKALGGVGEGGFAGKQARAVTLGEDGDRGVLLTEVFVQRKGFEGLLGEEEIVGLLALSVEVGCVVRCGLGRGLRGR